MADHRVNNLAQTLVNYCVEVREKDLVGIIAQPLATPLVQEVVREVLRRGGYPYLLPYKVPLPTLGYEGLDKIIFEEANDDQLKHLDHYWETLNKDFDVRIFILSEFNTQGIKDIDPERIKIHKQANKPIFDTYFERMSSGDLRRVSTLFPTQAYADDAGMSLKDFEDYVYSVTFSDSDDPVGEWKKMKDEQQVLVDWLKGKKQVEVRGPHAELSLSIEGRTFINSDGKQNMPSGEIFTGPVEDSVNGWIRFTHPCILTGKEVSGVELHFEEGRVEKASAEKNEDFLLSMLDMDQGSRYLGEFAIGTNLRINRFIKKILYDEKIGGTIHMALGQGYPITGSLNKSAIHWDMICDMRDGGQIIVDDELFYDSGEFVI
ncbi:MAG: aminopeptidase [Chloroflexota bacterium]|nr:MAG: aminopeptidase [Chloroflexota bacterium]